MPLQYTWFPQTVGFIRNTLQLYGCDLISGISTGSERVQNTNPYYRSIYTLVYANESGPFPENLSDDLYQDKIIGIVAGTPAADLLARYGLLPNAKPYQLMVDTRHYSSGRQAIMDVDAGVTDAAIVWGPIAGYFAQQAKRKLTVVPLLAESRNFQLDFWITMAVRFNDQDWKHLVNQVLEKLEPEIQEILIEYNVPLLDKQGELISQ